MEDSVLDPKGVTVQQGLAQRCGGGVGQNGMPRGKAQEHGGEGHGSERRGQERLNPPGW